jgi:hypothetical protein
MIFPTSLLRLEQPYTAFVAISSGRSMSFSERSPRRIKAEFLQQPELAMISKLLSAEMAEEKTRGI